jgi:hypothetical protein
MVAANFFRAFAALFGMLAPPPFPVVESPSGDSRVIELGSWTFSLPKDWVLDKEHEPGVPYFESADGTKGCYVKLIGRKQPSGTAPEFAADIQRIHRQALEALPGRKWRIMSDESSSTAGVTIATLDMFDSEHAYRVLSKVIASRDAAVQLTLHDYDCGDYVASRQSFLPIVESLGPRSQ